MSKRTPYEFATGDENKPTYWTSLEALHREETDPTAKAAAQAQAEQEFPPGAAEFTDPVSRRNFLGLMGASIALATAAGCRRPVERVLPYTRMPEHVIPGIANHYATVMDRHGEALGLLVESHEGRPTKIEGNPDHPSSGGAADMLAQASILELYDPDRSRFPAERNADRSFEQFDAAFTQFLADHLGDGGARLRVLAQPSISPTWVRLRALVRTRYPNARFHTWASASTSNAREGARAAFGAPMNVRHNYEAARVILSLDSDFLLTEPGAVLAQRQYANGRRLRGAADGERMNRLYVVEGWFSNTGSNADHRLRLASSQIEAYARALAAELGRRGADLGALGAAVNSATAPAGVPPHWITAVAADLLAHRGACVVVAGSRQPPAVHALAHAINHALGNTGQTVTLVPPADPDEADQAADLRALAEDMWRGNVRGLVVLGGNPVYDAPADLDFAGALRRVETSIHLSMHRDETSAACTWHVPRAHFLEAWGDAQSLDGTRSVQQPLIQPLYNGRSDIEVLAAMANSPTRRGYDLVRETVRGAATAANFRDAWRRALYQGVVGNSIQAAPVTAPDFGRIAAALTARAGEPAPAPTAQSLEVAFVPDMKMYDGRYANNAWLQELPDPLSKITWDNAAYFSPATATALGIRNGDMVKLTHRGQNLREGGSRADATHEVRIVAWVLPGQPDNVVTLPLGWGRRTAGLVGQGHGFDVSPLRTSDGLHAMPGVRVEKLGERYPISQTQEHHTMADRPIAIEATLAEYQRQPAFPTHLAPTPRTLPLWREVQYNGHKWGMTIDLNACTGCNACTVACQAENNIPVVGKDQVFRGREMIWLNVDRYFLGSDAEPKTAYQPRMCVHCEEAPCENVCPVNATTHSHEGLNDMAYNRCIGTRYCANNCPYKVRRFNYLNWHNDGAYQPRWSDTPETVRMQHNPNVTVRFRGVMEKCTYCVQRIQSHKIAAKREHRSLGGNEIVTACQQTCPTGAIVFGDLNDRASRVAELTRTDRRYKLLAELGTQPRTTHLAKVRNPNPEMHG